jgi:hypothetical protein
VSAAPPAGTWNFTLHSDGTWTWDHRDLKGREVARSERAFRYFHECVADASKHGYRHGGSGRKSELGCFFL